MAVYAWADLHGRIDLLWKGIMYINPEDKVYFLGDAADRGKDGWEIIKYILNDERFTYIKGNHEDLMVKALNGWEPYDGDPIDRPFYWNHDINLWYYNGGEVTHEAFENDESISNEEKIKILHTLKNLPFVCVYKNTKGQNVILSHAGYDDIDNGDEEQFIWDRNHLMFYDTWDGEDNEIIVHGHTPIELMIRDQINNAQYLTEKHMREGVLGDHLVEPQPWKGKGAYWYGKNHKCNIDTGAVWNGHSILLNLDTWEEIILVQDNPIT